MYIMKLRNKYWKLAVGKYVVERREKYDLDKERMRERVNERELES